MLKNVFKYPQYGLKTHMENVEDLKKHNARRKGKTKERRKELREKRRKEVQDARLKALRAAHAAVIKASNAVEESKKPKKTKLVVGEIDGVPAPVEVKV